MNTYSITTAERIKMSTARIELLARLVVLFKSVKSETELRSMKDKVVNDLLIGKVGCSLEVAEDWVLRAIERTDWKNIDLEWA